MIFLIDDDVELLETISDVLSDKGYHVAAFSDARHALREMDAGQRPSLIVSDVKMPGLDGFAFHREVIRRFGPHTIPFLFLSSLDDPEHIVAGLESGADDYVTKPIDWKVLRAKVAAILRSRLQRPVPRFVGDIEKLPFVKLLQFCELRSINGEIHVESPGVNATIPLNRGLLQEDDDTMNLVGRLMDLSEGTFEIRVRPPDFDEISHAAISPQNAGAGGISDNAPAGILTAIPVGTRLVQVQTECLSRPSPAIVTVAILDGRTLKKNVVQLPDFRDRPGVQRQMREQHRTMEEHIKGRISRKATADLNGRPSRLTRFNELFEKGLAAYRANQFQTAMEAWRQAAEIDPDNKVVKVNLTMLAKKIADR